MAKKPVQKLVTRNGQTHTQTYWEEDDPRAGHSSKLAGIAPSLAVPPHRRPERRYTADNLLSDDWFISRASHSFSDEDVQAAIEAELRVRAAISMSKTCIAYV